MALRRKGGFAGAATVAAAGFVGAALTADSASAAFTIDFGTASQGSGTYVEDPFTFSDARLERGDNCAGGACLALNKNESTTMSLTGGGTFDLLGLSYNLLGNPAELRIEGSFEDSGEIQRTFSTPKNELTKIYFNSDWVELEQVTLSNSGAGNVRVDDISAVPLPAAAWMMIGGLGMIGSAVARNRRKARADA